MPPCLARTAVLGLTGHLATYMQAQPIPLTVCLRRAAQSHCPYCSTATASPHQIAARLIRSGSFPVVCLRRRPPAPGLTRSRRQPPLHLPTPAAASCRSGEGSCRDSWSPLALTCLLLTSVRHTLSPFTSPAQTCSPSSFCLLDNHSLLVSYTDWCYCFHSLLVSYTDWCYCFHSLLVSYTDWCYCFLLNKKAWKHKREPSQGTNIVAVKWSSQRETILAVGYGCAPREGGSVILLQCNDGTFQRIYKFQVGGGVSSLSWDCSGLYLLTTIKSDARHPGINMVILKQLSLMRKRYILKDIKARYKESFTATFHSTQKCILSASTTSDAISVWAVDSRSFNWMLLYTITCVTGITDMRLSADGDFLAAIVQESLMVFSFTYEDRGEARLSEVEYVKDDGIIRNKHGAVSLKDHCESIISLDWGSSNFLATGSSMGSMCIYTWKAYETPAPSMGQFDILYYRWSNINSIDISGPVTCIGWSHAHPPVGKSPVISTAGNDGFVIAWEIIDGEALPEPTRNYIKEKNYFIPGYSDSPPGCVHDFDVDSISSISVSGSSDDLGDDQIDDPSEQSDVEVGEEPTYGNRKSDPTSATSDVKGDKDLTNEEISEEEQEDDTSYEEKFMLELNKLNDKAEGFKAGLSDVDTKLANIFDKQDTLQYWLDQGMKGVQADLEKVKEGVTKISEVQDDQHKMIEQIEKELKGFKLKYTEMAERHRRESDEVLSAVRNCHQKQNDIEQSIVLKHNHLEENVSRKQDQLHSEHQLKLNQIEKRIGNVSEVCDKILSRLDS